MLCRCQIPLAPEQFSLRQVARRYAARPAAARKPSEERTLQEAAWGVTEAGGAGSDQLTMVRTKTSPLGMTGG